MMRLYLGSPLFPYTTLFRSRKAIGSVLEKDPSRAAKHLVALLESTVPEVADTLGSAAQIASTSGEHFESGRLRSEEHTSELQSRGHLVCRLLLEKIKIK